MRSVHRVPANSKRGRQLAHAKGAVASDQYPGKLTSAQREWNANLERKNERKTNKRAA